MNGHEAGYVQILEMHLIGGLLHFVSLDRGPLWFNGFGTPKHFAAFCTALRGEYPQRLGRFMRFIPEIEDSSTIEKILTAHGFRKKSPGYQTIWIDLTQSSQDLRARLKGNWRGHLHQAENAGLEVQWDTKGLYLDWLLGGYASDKAAKGYSGPSVPFMHKLAAHYNEEGGLLIGRALDRGRPLAGILILCHGQSATYQIGWNSARGREKCAHNILLWQSLLYLKDKGFCSFDLGGVNDETAKGVKKFKQGLGGRGVTLAGLYR
ncbi:MAG: GNAT family N-acetyltransferase [Rhodospirillales bacterium]|nr:GNAT family N-acetyltransferase [Rhodospirillales bacterium]